MVLNEPATVRCAEPSSVLAGGLAFLFDPAENLDLARNRTGPEIVAPGRGRLGQREQRDSACDERRAEVAPAGDALAEEDRGE